MSIVTTLAHTNVRGNITVRNCFAQLHNEDGAAISVVGELDCPDYYFLFGVYFDSKEEFDAELQNKTLPNWTNTTVYQQDPTTFVESWKSLFTRKPSWDDIGTFCTHHLDEQVFGYSDYKFIQDDALFNVLFNDVTTA